MHKHFLKLVCLPVMTLLTTACSGGATGDLTSSTLAASNTAHTATPASVSSGSTSGTLADTDLVSPLLEFQSQGLSSKDFHNQTTRALSSCMQQRGWTFEPIIQNSQVPEPRTVGELREFRRTYGYGLYTTRDFVDTSPREAADRNGAYYSGLGADQQEEYRKDLNGDISGEGEEPVAGSCEALANEAVEVPGTDQAVMKEMHDLYQAARRSPEYLQASDSWRACLADRGYEIDRDKYPATLVDELSLAGAQPQEVVDFEMAIAVADFECALTTTMPVLYRMETEIVQELIEKYPEWGS